jgi:hypothetical protein
LQLSFCLLVSDLFGSFRHCWQVWWLVLVTLCPARSLWLSRALVFTGFAGGLSGQLHTSDSEAGASVDWH